MITASDLYKAHLQLHPQLPCSESVCKEYLESNPLAASSEDLKFVANLFADYVGSQSLYEDGTEEEW